MLLGAKQWLLLAAVISLQRQGMAQFQSSSRNYPSSRFPTYPYRYSSYDNRANRAQPSLDFETADKSSIAGESCSIVRLNKLYIPSATADELQFIIQPITAATSRESCAYLCCELGPSVCQYAWYFKEICVAVACGEGEESLCQPHLSNAAETYYMEMTFGSDSDDVTASDPSSESPTTTPTTPETTPTTQPTATTASTQESHDTITTATTTTATPTTEPPTTLPTTGTTQAPTVQTPVQALSVAISGEQVLTLPVNQTTLFANTWPEPRFTEQFNYHWEKLSGPKPGLWNGQTEKTIELYGLVEGIYQLKLVVTDLLSEHAPGESFINVTVLPAERVNSPPIPVIEPSDKIDVYLPQNRAILDASSTEDDLGAATLSFHWEEVSGLVDSETSASDGPVLVLQDLEPGHYQYRLTVVDQDGAQVSAMAEVIVHEERDYPPVASADNSRIIRLPQDEVYLYGNQSTDDKGNLQYQWQMVSGPGAVDLDGSTTPVLHAVHLTQGVYEFRLTVTDSAGQSNSVDVTVDVLSEDNTPPVADAGDNQTVHFPTTQATLDGRKSHDDYRITSHHWTQLSGPTGITLTGEDEATLQIEDLHIDESVGSPTLYEFMLTVVDYRNLTNSTTVFVEFHKDPKVPPNAEAGPNLTISLPENTVLINGLGSADDFGIVSYQWSKSNLSPAAGEVMDGSDTKPVLIMSNLVAGTYHFTLSVTNKNDEVDEDSMVLTVEPNPMESHLIQIYLEGDIANFTQADKVQFGKAIALLLEYADVSVEFQVVRAVGSNVMVEFYAVTSDGHPLNATVAYLKLTSGGQDYYFTRFHIVQVDMKVCKLPCSGHGSCDLRTRRCVCQSFWMENPFEAHFGKRKTNCDWSVFYVALVAVLSFALVLFVFWLCCCCCLKRRRIARTRRRVRYAILDHKDKEEAMEMLPKDTRSYQQSSLMVSESETEEEILFENSKKSGGINNASSPTLKKNNNKLKNNNVIPK